MKIKNFSLISLLVFTICSCGNKPLPNGYKTVVYEIEMENINNNKSTKLYHFDSEPEFFIQPRQGVPCLQYGITTNIGIGFMDCLKCGVVDFKIISKQYK